LVAAAGEQAAVAVDVFDVVVVVRVDLPSAPLQTRRLFVVMVQTPTDGDYGWVVGDVDEIELAVSVESDCLYVDAVEVLDRTVSDAG
jgi:hypothetical protein